MRKCDFCDRLLADGEPVKYFPTNEFFVVLLKRVPILAERGAWGACFRCAPHVAAKDLGGLFNCLPPDMKDARSQQMHEAVLKAIRWNEVEGYVYDENDLGK